MRVCIFVIFIPRKLTLCAIINAKLQRLTLPCFFANSSIDISKSLIHHLNPNSVTEQSIFRTALSFVMMHGHSLYYDFTLSTKFSALSF